MVRLECRPEYAWMSLCSLHDFIGPGIMALLSWSYRTMIYLLPQLGVTRKRPVLSVAIFPVNLMVWENTPWVQTQGASGVVGREVEDLVERTF